MDRDWGPTGRRDGTGRAAVALLLLLLLAAACSGGGGGGGDGLADATSGGAGPTVAAAEAVTAPRPVLTALHDERVLTTVRLLGARDLVEVAVDDPAEARRRTDAAIAELRAASDASGTGSPYRDALEALGGLEDLRADVDAHRSTATLLEVPFAAEVDDRYAALTDALLDDIDEAAAAVEEGEEALAPGPTLYAEGLRQVELLPGLRLAVLEGLQSSADPAWVRDTSALLGRADEGRFTVEDAAPGTPYADAAAQLTADLDANGSTAAIFEALQSGQVDVSHLLLAVDISPDKGWPAFVDAVERVLVDRS